MQVGIAGEIRAVVYRADGSIKTDTGFQKNLILNKGLDFFGGGEGSNMLGFCSIGSGNSAPAITQTSLDAHLMTKSLDGLVKNSDYLDDATGVYKTFATGEFRFVATEAMNVSEVGLSSKAGGAYMCTRALIKNTLGDPITVSVIATEVLVVYYTIYQIYSLIDVNRQINVVTNTEGNIPYNTKTRLHFVGHSGYGDIVGRPLADASSLTYFNIDNKASTTDIVSLTANAFPFFENSRSAAWAISLSTYVPGSYKRVYNITIDLAGGNNAAGIRSMLFVTTMGMWQVRFGKVDGDGTIMKTADFRNTFPLEISWGRYEGEL